MLSVDHSNIDGPALAVKCVRKFRSALSGEVVCVCGGGGYINITDLYNQRPQNEKRDHPHSLPSEVAGARIVVILFQNIAKKCSS